MKGYPTFSKPIEQAKEAKAKSKLADKFREFVTEWGMKVWDASGREIVLGYKLDGEEVVGVTVNENGNGFQTLAEFDYEPLIDEIFTEAFGPCDHGPNRICKTCEATEAAVYWEPPDVSQETIEAVVARYA